MVKRKNAADAAAQAGKKAATAAHEANIANIILHFDATYISGSGRLAAFQQLCRDLDVEVGTSLKQCKKVPNVPLHSTQPRTNNLSNRTSTKLTSTSTTSSVFSRPKAT
jgi:ribosomal protein S11